MVYKIVYNNKNPNLSHIDEYDTVCPAEDDGIIVIKRSLFQYYYPINIPIRAFHYPIFDTDTFYIYEMADSKELAIKLAANDVHEYMAQPLEFHKFLGGLIE